MISPLSPLPDSTFYFPPILLYNVPVPDSYAVADRLHSAAIHLLRQLRVKDVASGIGPARLSALSVLVFGGPCSLKQLADAEQVRPPTMTRIVQGLERAGLARRQPTPHDRRTARIVATARGVRVLQQGRRRRVEFLAEKIQNLTPPEMVELERALALIERILRQGPC